MMDVLIEVLSCFAYNVFYNNLLCFSGSAFLFLFHCDSVFDIFGLSSDSATIREPYRFSAHHSATSSSAILAGQPRGNSSKARFA
ncbi:hypothetical protein CAJAP_00044 [Camponotus japonicus]